ALGVDGFVDEGVVALGVDGFVDEARGVPGVDGLVDGFASLATGALGPEDIAMTTAMSPTTVNATAPMTAARSLLLFGGSSNVTALCGTVSIVADESGTGMSMFSMPRRRQPDFKPSVCGVEGTKPGV